MVSALVSLCLAIPMPAVLIGSQDRIIAANQGAADLLGDGQPDALSGRHYMTILRQPTVLDAVEATLRDGLPQETRYLANDGAQDTTFVTRCASVETGQGQGVLVSFEDITHFQQASQMRRDFVANVSHELRSPLTALMGFIETLRGPARNDKEASTRFLDIMQDEAERMERLVRDLLSLSRVEAQERVRPQTTVDLCEIVHSVLQTLTPLGRETNVSLNSITPEDDALVVRGDPDQLRQVLTNLVENAIKYGGPDRAVHVTLKTSENDPLVLGPAAHLTVQDEGPGFEAVHIPRLTERFYRVDNHRSREMGGTGLGLAIVKHILNRHRGRLRISSAVGKGSEFRAILPL
ncbi:ATP-binding protein [Roseovarius sp. 2305UL8-3]|uniref:ATP-binding protein n=1 Tax=Roseovarius conchicola TaxID=3121636 RepID=UPI0035290574